MSYLCGALPLFLVPSSLVPSISLLLKACVRLFTESVFVSLSFPPSPPVQSALPDGPCKQIISFIICFFVFLFRFLISARALVLRGTGCFITSDRRKLICILSISTNMYRRARGLRIKAERNGRKEKKGKDLPRLASLERLARVEIFYDWIGGSKVTINVGNI